MSSLPLGPTRLQTLLNLAFDLLVEDDWPPVSVEALPCTKVSGGYRVESAPLYIKDLSVGDEISVRKSLVGHVTEWSHLRRSRRSTVWLLRLATQGHVDFVLEELRRLNCNTVQLPQFGSYAIDVPENCSIAKVDAVLSKLDRSQVAVAYPSFRHA